MSLRCSCRYFPVLPAQDSLVPPRLGVTGAVAAQSLHSAPSVRLPPLSGWGRESGKVGVCFVDVLIDFRFPAPGGERTFAGLELGEPREHLQIPDRAKRSDLLCAVYSSGDSDRRRWSKRSRRRRRSFSETDSTHTYTHTRTLSLSHSYLSICSSSSLTLPPSLTSGVTQYGGRCRLTCPSHRRQQRHQGAPLLLQSLPQRLCFG